MKRIQESGEMYLETILILSESGATVRAIDIAERMNFSKPSVSRAMSILKNGELIAVDPSGAITLTAKGREIAGKIYERHTVVTEFLKLMGVDEATAIEDACKMEHDISDTTFDAIKRYVSEKRA